MIEEKIFVIRMIQYIEDEIKFDCDKTCHSSVRRNTVMVLYANKIRYKYKSKCAKYHFTNKIFHEIFSNRYLFTLNFAHIVVL